MTQSNVNRRVLVTGGAGFIGYRAARLLQRKGHDVAVLDNLHVGMPMPTDPGLVSFMADIRDEAVLTSAFTEFRPDTVIHLAAIHHIPTCERQRTFAQDVNILGTEMVLKAAEGANVGRIVLASSGAVYDWVDTPLQEQGTSLWACDNYALCKLANESQLRFWQDRGPGREARVARIFNTIGHDDPNAHLIPDILNQLNRAAGKATIRLGNLAPKRDYIHADDTAAGIVALALAETASQDFFIANIGSGQEASVEDLVRMIGRAMNVLIDIEVDESRIRRVDRLRQLADVSRMAALTGWRAQRSLAQSVQDIVENFAFSDVGGNPVA